MGFFPIVREKCLSQALLVFPIVISSLSSKGKNFLGPILVYLCAFPSTSSPHPWFLGGSFFVVFVRFVFISSLSFFHAASPMNMLEHVTVIYAVHAGSGSFRLGQNFSCYFTLVWFWVHFILFGLQLILLSFLFHLK